MHPRMTGVHKNQVARKTSSRNGGAYQTREKCRDPKNLAPFRVKVNYKAGNCVLTMASLRCAIHAHILLPETSKILLQTTIRYMIFSTAFKLDPKNGKTIFNKFMAKSFTIYESRLLCEYKKHCTLCSV